MIQLLAVFLYLLAVGVIDWIAYGLLNQRWAAFERARITVGVLLVFAPAAALVLAGLLHGLTFAVLLLGFCVAGAVTLLRDIEAAQGDDLRAEVNRILEDK